MDKENNMKLDADWQATTEEQGDIRSALNRMDVEAPDVDMAWKAMSQQMACKKRLSFVIRMRKKVLAASI